ncbi:DUF397 domain-containing protein [Streptomyces sp. ISL-96]|uniref:DUF397 domain-containing protein n=1 Tax=unclassified Streptomyces TaxID=2593676 RepID=UPI001BEB5F4D|nr:MULTISPECIES: DUF397 domain-containing protein [unclassified Streptomyces]MBT2399712.1 DUF397 domain-containing protein [Streptomyces sp. ISL-100]MBT2491783.1 DUF397 domain-containing protein [Streptomyces sp. ISL-96]
MSRQVDLSKASWVKSSYSAGDRDCVEVALIDGKAGIRDSKAVQGPVLVVTSAAFTAFLSELTQERPHD